MSVAAAATAEETLAQAETFLRKRDLAQARHALEQAQLLGADPNTLCGQL